MSHHAMALACSGSAGQVDAQEDLCANALRSPRDVALRAGCRRLQQCCRIASMGTVHTVASRAAKPTMAPAPSLVVMAVRLQAPRILRPAEVLLRAVCGCLFLYSSRLVRKDARQLIWINLPKEKTS